MRATRVRSDMETSSPCPGPGALRRRRGHLRFAAPPYPRLSGVAGLSLRRPRTGVRNLMRVPRLHIELPVELHKRAKIAAVQRGVTLKAFVIQALEQAIEQQEQEAGQEQG